VAAPATVGTLVVAIRLNKPVSFRNACFYFRFIFYAQLKYNAIALYLWIISGVYRLIFNA
jgi:hypothetical protein